VLPLPSAARLSEDQMTKTAVTPAEAFASLSLSRTLGYRMIAEGRLRATRVTPKKLIIATSELERFAQERDSAATA
jgi:predicted site-specific integrase-resolvase